MSPIANDAIKNTKKTWIFEVIKFGLNIKINNLKNYNRNQPQSSLATF